MNIFLGMSEKHILYYAKTQYIHVNFCSEGDRLGLHEGLCIITFNETTFFVLTLSVSRSITSRETLQLLLERT